MQHRRIKTILLSVLLASLLMSGLSVSAESTPQNPSQTHTNSEVDTSIGTINSKPVNTNNRIAPGEYLPISVKLVNFGSQKRVDVIVNYQILDSNQKEVYAESETVAVDTTASFVKHIQLPYSMPSGSYTAVSSLNYPYQVDPAVSKFTFAVEQKILGVFRSDFITYSMIALAVALIVVFAFYILRRWLRRRNVVVHDYSDKPKDQMIYYEILSNIISQMRMRIGNDALEIAKNIPDLEINDKNGLVKDIKKDPAKIIALLIFRFEKLSGRRLSFGIR